VPSVADRTRTAGAYPNLILSSCKRTEVVNRLSAASAAGGPEPHVNLYAMASVTVGLADVDRLPVVLLLFDARMALRALHITPCIVCRPEEIWQFESSERCSVQRGHRLTRLLDDARELIIAIQLRPEAHRMLDTYELAARKQTSNCIAA
jgi:hypothetical protein